MKIDYMKPSQVRRIKVNDCTKKTLKNGKRVDTFTSMVRQLNKDIKNS